MKLKIATVQYLNALPFLDALRQMQQDTILTLIEAKPSECAALLLNDSVDIALLPIGAMEDFQKLFVLTDFCIGCFGKVRTVKLFSDFPIQDVQQIILDPSSRSSNLLIKTLVKYHWNLKTIIFSFPEAAKIGLKTAKLKIGDDVFEIENTFKFEYDLGKEWNDYAGLPFVFACWVSKTKPDNSVLDKLNETFKASILRLPSLVQTLPLQNVSNLSSYFAENISYDLDETKKESIVKFMGLANIKTNLIFS
ncbi:MAG: hypothetical protein IPO78_10465 [Saprospiraceae bacterium]|nr:hypothetical protein [Saprospiraceae bacterium]MBK9729068.1 hypothetical protein [Saprospiraceae bacterium]